MRGRILPPTLVAPILSMKALALILGLEWLGQLGALLVQDLPILVEALES